MQRQCRGTAEKGRRAAVAALTLLGLAAGCRAPKPGPPPRPAPRWSGVTVRIACPPGAAHRLLQSHGRTWAHDNDATLSLVAPTEAADAVVLAPTDLPSWAAADKLRPLPDASITAAFLPLYRARLLNWDGHAFALPLLGDGLVCVFRADLYADAATRTAFKQKHGADLAPPETWDDFATQSAFFAAQRRRPSLPPLAADDAGLDRDFGVIAASFAIRAATGSLRPQTGDDTGRAAAFSFQYDAGSGEPRIASPGFVEALKFFRDLQPLRSPKENAIAAFRADEAVIGIVTLDELAALRSASQARWGVVRVPGSRRVFAAGAAPEGFVNVVPYVGSTGALGAVPKTSACPDAAFDLLTYLSSDAVSQEAVHDPTFGGGPFRDAHLSKQPAGWFNYGLDEANTARLREALREMADPRLDNPAIALRIPAQDSHRKPLVTAIRRVVQDNSDPAAALAEVEREWRKLDGDASHARLMYRKSLGL